MTLPVSISNLAKVLLFLLKSPSLSINNVLLLVGSVSIGLSISEQEKNKIVVINVSVRNKNLLFIIVFLLS